MNRRVLIVSPHFPPINAPDHQRVRMSLPYFPDHGWEPVVLAVRPEDVEGVRDPLLEKTVPPHIRIIRTKAFSATKARKFGVGSFGLRALPYLRRAGDQLLRQERIDLIYFSTTVFPAMSLGPRWLSRFGIPYVLDFQDPWLSDYYRRLNAPQPPGGRFKYGVSQMLARLLEPYTVRHMGHTISVSSAYPKVLLSRYPSLRQDDFTVLPFGAPEKDFEQLATLNVRQCIFDPRDGKRHIVYVGVVSPSMRFTLRAFFAAVRQIRDRGSAGATAVKLHFVGTSYARGGRAAKSVEPVAREFGVADIVEEYPQRIAYFEALKVLQESHAILLIGSDDPGYTASKLYPCILARKPILALFHEKSSVIETLRFCNAGRAVTFNADSNDESLCDQIALHLGWLLSLPEDYIPQTDWVAFAPFTAREMTRKQCQVFDRCLSQSGVTRNLWQ